MIHSLFIINTSGDVCLEKHWKSVVPRSVCDYFLRALRAAPAPEEVPCVLAAPHHYLVSVLRSGCFYVAVCVAEVPPLFLVEFLHRAVDIFEEYLGEVTEAALKEHHVLLYELLDELLDNGFPLATEGNILKELIRPPNLLRTLANQVTGKTNITHTLPAAQLSNVPWRRAGVKYTSNDMFLDLTEEVDAILDPRGGVVAAGVTGRVDCLVRLSGTPDLTLSFTNPRLLDDVSFHPSVRLRRWEEQRVLSFVPPDGQFRLLTYSVAGQAALPLYLRHSVAFAETGGRLDLTLGPRNTQGRQVEGIQLSIPLPRCVLSCSVVGSQGRHSFDPHTRLLVWEVGKLDPGRLPNLRGTLSLQSGVPLPDSNPCIGVQFSIPGLALSGLRVNSLDLHGEAYKPFKGVKYATKAGDFQIRT